MLRIVAVILVFGFATTVFAGQKSLQITGCSFDVIEYYKHDIPTTGTWTHGFDVEKRQGWGYAMKKLDTQTGEAYLGSVDLDSDGTKMDVVVSTDAEQKLSVKTVIKRVNGDSIERLASGDGSAQFVADGNLDRVMAKAEAVSPVIAKIQAEKPAPKTVFDSANFPLDTLLFNAVVHCHAGLK